MLRLIARSAAGALIALAAHSTAVSAQVAPTLPSDTLQGRKLPPEANVPRQVIAPTLPSDTLKAAERLCTEAMGSRPVASTPRPPAGRSDTLAAATDTTDAPCRMAPAPSDSAAPTRKEN
jgi:hypothetical protein